jgi:hypothetical protein
LNDLQDKPLPIDAKSRIDNELAKRPNPYTDIAFIRTKDLEDSEDEIITTSKILMPEARRESP